MLDYNDFDLFDMLETVSLMDDYEFEKMRLEFENNGYILKRNKNENGDTNITVKKSSICTRTQSKIWVFFFCILRKKYRLWKGV